jgi:hypothetical protein
MLFSAYKYTRRSGPLIYELVSHVHKLLGLNCLMNDCVMSDEGLLNGLMNDCVDKLD